VIVEGSYRLGERPLSGEEFQQTRKDVYAVLQDIEAPKNGARTPPSYRTAKTGKYSHCALLLAITERLGVAYAPPTLSITAFYFNPKKKPPKKHKPQETELLSKTNSNNAYFALCLETVAQRKCMNPACAHSFHSAPE
jgi:hypothetical protein